MPEPPASGFDISHATINQDYNERVQLSRALLFRANTGVLMSNEFMLILIDKEVPKRPCDVTAEQLSGTLICDVQSTA
jgi:hypothetical protein